jgi:transposase
MKTLPQPWTVAMGAMIFTGWIYDHLLPNAAQVKVAHPVMLRAIALAKKKNDRIIAGKIADRLRCDFLPECHMASTEIRDRRRSLRYRHLLVRWLGEPRPPRSRRCSLEPDFLLASTTITVPSRRCNSSA